MAAALVMRWVRLTAAAMAIAFIAILAFHGERPEPGLVNFQAAGLLADWAVDGVTSVIVVAGGKQRSFHRLPGDHWRADEDGVRPVPTERINAGLALLRDSAPQRWLAADEISDRSLAEFGLDPPRLAVTIGKTGGESITLSFGGTNPLGLARYARINGRPGLVLLQSFVADPWEQVAEQ